MSQLEFWMDVFVFDKTGVWTQDFALANQALYCLSHTSSPFCSGYFGDGVSWTICPGWPCTAILPMSASQAARITGTSHWCPAAPGVLASCRWLKICFQAWLQLCLMLPWVDGKVLLILCECFLLFTHTGWRPQYCPCEGQNPSPQVLRSKSCGPPKSGILHTALALRSLQDSEEAQLFHLNRIVCSQCQAVFFFFFYWTQGLARIRITLYYVSITQCIFFSETWSHSLCQGWPQTCSHPVSTSWVAEINGVYHHSWLLCCIVLGIFSCGCGRSLCISSAHCVARSTGTTMRPQKIPFCVVAAVS
jgi:hypothetical protein